MFIIIEIATIGVGTVIAVGIMYLHSLAAFDYAPPKWLFKTLMLDCRQSTAEKIVTKIKDFLITNTQPVVQTAMTDVGYPVDLIANFL
jgi:hypothetical protein